MAPTIRVAEPHPTITAAPQKKQSQKIPYGRGGAGNFVRPAASTGKARATSSMTANFTAAPETTQAAQGPAVLSSASSTNSSISSSSSRSSKSSKTFSGRGGAGNARPASERRIFSFDEELDRLSRLADNAAGVPVFHIGRGGAGNMSTGTGKDAQTSPETNERGSGTTSGVDTAGMPGARVRKGVESVKERMARAFSRE